MTAPDIAFLLARVGEREAQAPRVHVEGCPSIVDDYGGVAMGPCDCGEPARVLAECAALRKIVELHRGNHECSNADDSCAWVLDGDCDTNWHLAQVWADHPDYRSEWDVG